MLKRIYDCKVIIDRGTLLKSEVSTFEQKLNIYQNMSYSYYY